MTQFVKAAGYHVPVYSRPRARRSLVPSILLGFALAFTAGYLTARVRYIDAVMIGDGAARTDYAELVNACYDRNHYATAADMYDCIATGN